MNKKEVIYGKRINRESFYYGALFGAGAIVSAVLCYIGKTKANKGLMSYALVLLSIFLVATLVSARFAAVSANTVHKKDGKLTVKTFFCTRRFDIDKIERVTVAQNGESGKTSVNITYGGKVVNYRFKSFTKEEVSHLRRATSLR